MTAPLSQERIDELRRRMEPKADFDITDYKVIGADGLLVGELLALLAAAERAARLEAVELEQDVDQSEYFACARKWLEETYGDDVSAVTVESLSYLCACCVADGEVAVARRVRAALSGEGQP